MTKTKCYNRISAFGVKKPLWLPNVVCPGIAGVGQLWLAHNLDPLSSQKKSDPLQRCTAISTFHLTLQ